MLGILGIITGSAIGALKAGGRAAGEATRAAGGGRAFVERHWASLLAAAVIGALLLQVLVGFDGTGGR